MSAFESRKEKKKKKKKVGGGKESLDVLSVLFCTVLSVQMY